MKSSAKKSSAYGFAAQAVALAATFGLSLSGPHRASAQGTAPVAQNDSSPAVTILSPAPRTTYSGVKPVEISAFYQGSSTNQIAVIELYVDGVKAAQKVLDTPETRGVVSFLVDAGALSGGTHRIVVRASAADAEVASAKSSFIFTVPAPDKPNPETPSLAPSLGSPVLSIDNPTVDGQVQGKVTLRIKAEDPSGKPPYVSLFIDHSFKTLRNYAPYEFTWDTTEYPNGYHTIEAFGYNDAQDVGHAQPIRVLVNNPGGRTERRTDLRDAPKPHVTPKTHVTVKPLLAAKPLAKAHAASKISVLPPLTVTPDVRAAAPVVKTAKAAPILRRPTPATLAQSAPKVRAQHTQLAKLPKLDLDEMALTQMPELSSPFVSDTVRPRTVTPTRGFKPLLPALRVTKTTDAVLANAPTASAVQTHHALIMAKAILPSELFSNKFLVSPSLPQMKATVQTLTARTAVPVRALRVSVPVTHHTQRLVAHTFHRSGSVNWLHAAGEKSLLFNSTRLPLERPLVAEGSVMFGPLRQIFEAGGGSLMWQARTGVVTAHTDKKDIALTMGSKTAQVNQMPVTLDAAPYIDSGRTMISLSFLQTALDVTVQYDAATGHLLVNSSK